MLENTKKEVEKILELKNKDKIKIQNRYEIIGIFSIIIIFSQSLINIVVNKAEVAIFSIIFFIFSVGIGIFTTYMLYEINKVICKKNIKENIGLKLLSENNFVSNKKRKKIKEELDSLSFPARKVIENNRNKKNIDYNNILNELYFFKVMSLNIKDFIYYINNEIENDFSFQQFNFSKNELIKKKLTSLLDYIKEEDFNTYQQNLMAIIELITDKSPQLKLFKKMKELREKYDEKVISSEIENIKNELNKKQRKNKNIKVLQSI
tara:strand:+ start:14711 stop:15502 length:792 start_codon:yes stop_codon:yes gene_type:complete